MCINQIGVYFIYRLQIDFKVYNIDLRRRWAWHRIFGVNNICAWYLANIMPSLMFLALIKAELCVFIQTEKIYGEIEMAQLPWLVMLNMNKYTLQVLPRFLLYVTNTSPKLIYPFQCT